MHSAINLLVIPRDFTQADQDRAVLLNFNCFIIHKTFIGVYLDRVNQTKQESVLQSLG